MRSSPKSEKEKQDIEASERRERRKGGFDLQSVRDRGYAQLSNGVVITWYVEPENRAAGLSYDGMPNGYFILRMGKEKRYFDKEEFMKWLRWV